MSDERRPSAAALRPVGAVDMLDRALLLARQRGIEPAMRAWAGGLTVALVLLAVYYLERVEGIAGLRPIYAMALVLAWWIRSWTLSRVAREDVQHVWAGVTIPPAAGRFVDVARTASVVALGLWVWLWPVVGASYIGSVAVALTVPILSVRGAAAPAWIARAGCTAEGGLRSFFRAAGDSSGRRTTGFLLEMLVLLGALVLFVDLAAMIGFLVVLGRSLLGIEVAFAEAFLSFRNDYFLLAVAVGTLVLLEPLRAAISAVVWVDARVRREGLDLRAAVDEAVAAGGRRGGSQDDDEGGSASGTAAGGGKGVSSAAVVLLACSLGLGALGGAAATARAQQQPASRGDVEVQREVREILGRSEFREYEDDRGKTLREALERLIEWLLSEELEMPEGEGIEPPSLPVPPGELFLVLALVLLGIVAAYLVASHVKDREPTEEGASPEAERLDPRERAPAAHLDAAAALAAQGRYREALRSLYVATLVALDRRGEIAFDPHLTNWQYIRQMPRGGAREQFREFTRLFDYKWYGDEPTDETDYDHVRELADAICAPREEGT